MRFENSSFINSGNPKHQGEESVLLLVVVVGDCFLTACPCTVFWGVKGKNFASKGV